jgi:hypothetical protein
MTFDEVIFDEVSNSPATKKREKKSFILNCTSISSDVVI